MKPWSWRLRSPQRGAQLSIRVLAVILVTSLVAAPAAAQSSRSSASWAATLANDVRVVPDITYLTANNWQTTLDVYTPAGPGPHPTILHIHYGIADVADLLDGPNTRNYAVQWLGSRLDRHDVARRLSPLTYVRRDLPPILTIHGDADPTVPYSHATRLQAALAQAGATSELVTIPGGKHGGFPAAQQVRAVDAVRTFLGKHGLMPHSSDH